MKKFLLSSSVRSPYTFANVRCNRFSSTNGNRATPKTNVNNSETVSHIVDMFNTWEKCPYLEFYWSAFSHIRTEYGELLRKSSYSLQMQENTDQENSKYAPFLLNVSHLKIFITFFEPISGKCSHSISTENNRKILVFRCIQGL